VFLNIIIKNLELETIGLTNVYKLQYILKQTISFSRTLFIAIDFSFDLQQCVYWRISKRSFS